ncbi:MAG: radical SAM protein [Clostridiales bacterium]|nr:radical SAM protein [Clostridiales bacterium]
MSALKEKLYEELKLKLTLAMEGVSYKLGVFDNLLKERPGLRKEYVGWDKEIISRAKYDAPTAFNLPYGQQVNLVEDSNSPYTVEKTGELFHLAYRGEYLTSISFPEKQPDFYFKRTSDGMRMRDIGFDSSAGSPRKSLVFSYSSECAVKDKGETCLFCCYNRDKILDNEKERPPFRNSTQIAETAKAAYDEGFSHLTITGGFIPERREVEYYLDVAEEIQNHLGADDFNGTACIGAPLDLSVIEKYKEAGFRTIAFNTEVWRKEYFEVYCPGKVTMCGGYDNWIAAIRHAIDVFGKGKVRSNFVAGLQPKEILMEGIEELASIGVVTLASSWIPVIGSPLEGHRSPTPDWHWDVQLKSARILRKYGRTLDEIFDAAPARTLAHEIYEIEDETLPAYSAYAEAV